MLFGRAAFSLIHRYEYRTTAAFIGLPREEHSPEPSKDLDKTGRQGLELEERL